jgi:hypothetical protein
VIHAKYDATENAITLGTSKLTREEALQLAAELAEALDAEAAESAETATEFLTSMVLDDVKDRSPGDDRQAAERGGPMTKLATHLVGHRIVRFNDAFDGRYGFAAELDDGTVVTLDAELADGSAYVDVNIRAKEG